MNKLITSARSRAARALTSAAQTLAPAPAGPPRRHVPSDRVNPDTVAPVAPAEGVDGFEILDKVVALPISTWRYQWEPAGVRHLGPMSQDWKAAFDLGDTDRSISNVDGHGVALVSIQALHRLIIELRDETTALRAEVTELREPR
ncbi:tail fiber domain-containing protein [Streptomyces sp. NBC_00503]|uniref:tail fiber domain-containing protein n=1 Tax=Streptomyces sp. NBC_00503 TaxID=2903659 RepID=UPI002E813F01|nr:tail fiber domain-containing protein [Streptomyces sp. NBC_00503]WUD85692.1 tail fiber domain-containing protein [Streptomyces sp. NBC_00503]